MIWVFSAFDWLSSISGAKIMAQNPQIFDRNKKVTQKV